MDEPQCSLCSRLLLGRIAKLGGVA